ncbi:unnamed protein product, partial [Gulo gulo]
TEAASVEEQKEIEDKVASPEKAEEAKVKAKPHLAQKPGGSNFLRRQLQNRQNYFDSGNYNMAKAKMNEQLATAVLDKTEVTGDHSSTPQDLPQQKLSLLLASWLVTKRAKQKERKIDGWMERERKGGKKERKKGRKEEREGGRKEGRKEERKRKRNLSMLLQMASFHSFSWLHNIPLQMCI